MQTKRNHPPSWAHTTSRVARAYHVVDEPRRQTRVKLDLVTAANTMYQKLYLERAKRQKWTGWENAGLDKVAHLGVSSLELIAVLKTIEEVMQ